LTGVIAFPYFAVLNHGGYALIFIAIVLSLVLHAMQYGPQAALIGESFPTHLRYGGAGIGYQLASVFEGPRAVTRDLAGARNRYALLDFRVHNRRRGCHGGVRSGAARPIPREHRRHRRLQPCLEARPDQRTQRRLRPTR
jgi:hypothetical protein